MPREPSPGSALIGRRLGAYVVEELLGEGAMGAVYAAQDVNLRRRVALKVIRRSLAEDAQYVDRFLREARAAARLNHPNIVHVYYAGTDGGVAFLALELVRGGTVAQLLRRAGGKLPVRRACEIARDAALGLAAAHAEGIVHRDVKPDNMLIEAPSEAESGAAAGRVKLTDFGIARVAAMAQRITQSGLFVGTPRYASPEQCQANPVDGRSDLYSLGVSLYEMLAGTTPHASDGAAPLALLSKIVNDPPRPIREVNPDVPESVAAIVARLLEKEPGARYADAGALVRELEAVIATLPHEVLKIEPPTAKRTRRALETGPVPGLEFVSADGSSSSSISSIASAETFFTPPAGVEVAPPPERAARGPARAALIARVGMIDRLAEGGHPVAALRAAAVVAREVADAGVDASTPLYRTLGKIVAMLRDPETRFRPVPSLLQALEAFRLLDIGLALLAGEVADTLEQRGGSSDSGAVASGRAPSPPVERPARTHDRPVHALAIVHLQELSVGLALPWKWDELVGAYDDAVVPLDADGRQQVLAAATVLMGLVPLDEYARLKRFNEGRQIVPVVSLRNVGSIQGTSAGLPTLIAMIAARYGVVPRRGLAATGALDAGTIPPLPTPDRPGLQEYERFLNVRIRGVEAAAAKVQAVLEQCPEVDWIVLPRANESDVLGKPDLAGDLRACGVKPIFVETVRDVLAAELFEPKLVFSPLRLDSSERLGLAARAAASRERGPAEAAHEARRLADALRMAKLLAAGSATLLAMAAWGAAGG